MWFRRAEIPETESLAIETSTMLAAEQNNNNNNNNNCNGNKSIRRPSPEASKFEKFRRASFRRKSLTLSTPAALSGAAAPTGGAAVSAPRKRSQSPHIILRNEKMSALAAAAEVEEPASSDSDDDDDDDDEDDDDAAAEADDDTSPTTLGATIAAECQQQVINLFQPSTSAPAASTILLPISDPPAKNKASSKKATIKALKTDPPKRKFYKNFTSRRQNSRDDVVANNAANAKDDDDALPANGKEKILLTDPKFRNNRIEKSSSKTKIADLEKRESIKRSRSGRKLAAPPVLVGAAEDQKLKKKNAKNDKSPKTANVNNASAANTTTTTDNEPAAKFTRARAHSNLNLSALVKFVVNNKKLINANDFALIRRKSISEAASSIMSVAASCKPTPIALKYTQDGAIAEEPPPELDGKASKNVVLVKKQQFKNSFYENTPSLNNKSYDCPDNATKEVSSAKHKLVAPTSTTTTTAVSNKVKRNSSNSSKSSGNFEDEAFYSCDEQDLIDKLRNSVGPEDSPTSDAVVVSTSEVSSTKTEISAKASGTTSENSPKRKSSSPSLTSRVAAKINETTNNYKNRKAAAAASKSAAKKQRKSAASTKRPEFYKQISVERLHSTSIVRQPSDRRPDATNTSIRSNGNTSQQNSSDLQGIDATGGSAADAGTTSNAAAGTDGNALDAAEGNSREARRERLQQQHQQNKSAPVSVNRSESYKERLSHKRNRNSRRKTSDPSLTSRPNDEQPDLGLSNSNYTASSNSSLSSGGGSESPSTSMEQMTAGAPGQHQQPAAHGHQQQQHHHHHQHSHQDSFHGSTGSGTGSVSNANNISFWSGASGPTIGQLTRQWQFESDEEDDLLIEADWSSNVAAEMLAKLTDAEKKRQEIINEIYQTERNHVRTLKLLERLFFCPLQESGVLSIDHLLLLFPPALITLRELHNAFEQKLKQRRIEHNHVVNQVGDLLAGMFDGQSGDELREYAAQFCARQQIALEALKEKRRKDEQLQKILSKAESHKACRRLQLKDLLPTVLQRLTKYPLLFENLYKVTIRVVPDDVSEAEAIQRALESSKKILVDVNQAVKLAEDAHKLQTIQRKLDKSTFDKEEFKNLDLTQHRLIHDGSLTMKKNPGIQLHGLLFESMIVLLTKQDDKYSLKYLNATRISEVNNKPLSPIMNIDSETLVRQEAADKNSFFLIKTKTSQMLELRAPSSSECKTWFKHISDAAEQYKPRSKNANHEPVDDPAIATLPHSSTKESLELTPERPPPVTATATMTTTPLAPMMMMPNNNQHAHQQHAGIDIRGDREGTPGSDMGLSMSAGSTSSSVRSSNQHMNNNDLLSSAVNRTMSTRSCGETNNNNNFNGDRTLQQQPGYVNNNGVILRHTQSARQAATNGGSSTSDDTGIGSGSKRDSNSIIYSNNSNNTRTLMQSSAPLVEPTAIQISISPAHTAEPVLTPAEKLRRLDAAIRDGLLEKQKIICDMFRLPIEHFHEIVDIASLPEAPKDSADIALAAYAQVQSLTEVVNEYMKVTPEQEISAVSTSVCDQCHEKQQRKQQLHHHSCNSSSVSRTPLAPMSATTSSTSSSNLITKRTRSPSPPPLPPPNKQQAQAQHKTATPPAKLQTHSLDEQIIHEDDDGYCEIDELRLPTVPSMMSPAMMSALLAKPAPAAASNTTAPPPLPPPAGTFKVPPTPPPPPSAAVVAAATAANGSSSSTAERSSSTSPELTKRQSTISADSIPEESADEVTQAMDDEAPQPTATAAAAAAKPSTEVVKSLSDAPAAAAETVSATENKEIKDVKEKQEDVEAKQAEAEEKSAAAADEQKSEKSEEKKKEIKKEGVVKEDVVKEKVVKEDVVKEEIVKEESVKEEVVKEEIVKEEVVKAEDKKEAVKKEEIKKEETVQNKDEEQQDSTATNTTTTDTDVQADSSSSSASTAKTTADADDADNKINNEKAKKKEETEKEDDKSQLDSKTVDKNEGDDDDDVSSKHQPAEPQRQNSAATTADAESLDSEAIELNETYEALMTLNKLNTALSMVDNMCQTTLTGTGFAITSMTTTHCGPNRIMHATSLEPSVPCHALNSIVTALNSQISLLLPKINERDMERERLRKENQHLRELLNAMHERQRVEAKIETPKDITTSADANDEIDAPAKSTTTNTSKTNNINNNNTTTSPKATEAATAPAPAKPTETTTTSKSTDAAVAEK